MILFDFFPPFDKMSRSGLFSHPLQPFPPQKYHLRAGGKTGIDSLRLQQCQADGGF